MSSFEFPEKIDRFIIKDVLGRGAQGVVYLATDPSLDRQVAIKSVSLRDSFQQQHYIDNLLQEARTVSRLQHANIVSIYDIGSEQLNPFLVLEYVEGDTLQALMRQPVPMPRAIKIMRDVLSGVAAAHELGIIHCDLKPANIMINAQGQAKVADFGLALLADQQQESEELAGTPQYMAPEYIETRKHQTVSDVFSLGLIFYQLLTGQLAVDGDDVYQLLNAIANKPIEPPSRINPKIDERLESVILKALQKKPRDRYQTAAEMLSAFNKNLSLSDAMKQADSSDATVKFLLRRMNHKKDFPAFSQTISILNRASSSETESLSTVANAILKDISLTNKILRIVNSAYYHRGGDKISTISRAVVMLGIEPIKSLAASLMLFDHLQDKSQAEQLMENAVVSLFSALLANDMARKHNIRQHEEAFLCSLLQQLGKLLVRFYLHEESLAIDQQIDNHGFEETTAAIKVLGTSYHDLGMAVAREWGFPAQIIDSMKPLSDEQLFDPDKQPDSLQVIANFSNEICQTLQRGVETEEDPFAHISQRYHRLLDIDSDKISSLIRGSQDELTRFSELINFKLTDSHFYHQLSGDLDDDSEVDASLENTQDIITLEETTVPPLRQTSEKALTDGIQDITNTLTGDYNINEILQMILETIYRGLGGSRVLLGLRNKATNCIEGKYGYGEDIEELIHNFTIPLAYQADVFHVAFSKNVDIKIDDTEDEKIRDKIPQWYHRKIGSKFFILFPIVVQHSPLAVIYIDSNRSAPIKLSDNQLGLLKTLRNQAVLAIKNLSH